eukprot:3005462-Amphidinium_carterae.1
MERMLNGFSVHPQSTQNRKQLSHAHRLTTQHQAILTWLLHPNFTQLSVSESPNPGVRLAFKRGLRRNHSLIR